MAVTGYMTALAPTNGSLSHQERKRTCVYAANSGIAWSSTIAGPGTARRRRFVANTAWTDHIIWSAIRLPLLIGVRAVYFWRTELRTVRPSRSRQHPDFAA